MKALDEYILMVLRLMVLLKWVHFLQTKPKGLTTHTKALDKYILIVESSVMLLSNRDLKGNIQMKGDWNADFPQAFNSLVNILEDDNITIVAKEHVAEDKKNQKEVIDSLKVRTSWKLRRLARV